MNPIAKAYPPLNVKEIQDVYVQKNFRALQDYFADQNQFLNFKFIEFVATGAVTNQKLAHGLGIIPQDVVITRSTGPGLATLNWSNFDSTNLDISTTGACRARLFVGSYWNSQPSRGNDPTDSQLISPSQQSSISSIAAPPPSSLIAPVFLTGTTGTPLIYQMKTVDTVTFGDASSASLTIVLPPASSAYGQGVYTLRKTDQTLNSITISVYNTVSEVVVTPIGSVTSTTLNTVGETLRLISAGAGWQTLERKADTGMIAYIPATQGLGVPASTACHYMRVVSSIFLKGRITAGTPTAVQMNIGLPGSLTISSTLVPTIATFGNMASTIGTTVFSTIANGGNAFINAASISSGNQIQVINGNALVAAGSTISYIAGPIPITEWQT